MMAEREQWGPWVKHDGTPRPDLCGCYLMAKLGHQRTGTTVFDEGIVAGCSNAAWDWELPPGTYKVLEFRIRRPRGLQLLEGLISDSARTPQVSDA